MIIDTYSASKLVRLHATLKPDEKIIIRNGCILDVEKKTKLELLRDRLVGMVKR